MGKKKKEAPPSHTLIENPSAIRTPEIEEEQDKTDELVLDEELELVQDLDRISKCMEAQEKIIQEERQEQSNETAKTEDAEALLQAQISEDQALLAATAAAEEESSDQLSLAAGDPLESKPEETNNEEHDATEQLSSLDLVEIQSCIEALLFMSDKPVSRSRLQEMLGLPSEESIFAEAIQNLKERYQMPHHGIELSEVAGGFQFRTKPGRADLAKKLAKIQFQRLSSGSMETLAIIAYKQPVMKEDIDQARGVDSSYFLRGLLDRKLIRMAGRSELPGRPILYETSEEFLQVFGLKDLGSLPPLRELQSMIPNSESAHPEDEDPRVREMRKLVSQMKRDGSSALQYDPREDEKILAEFRSRIQSIPTTTATLKALDEPPPAIEESPTPALETERAPID